MTHARARARGSAALLLVVAGAATACAGGSPDPAAQGADQALRAPKHPSSTPAAPGTASPPSSADAPPAPPAFVDTPEIDAFMEQEMAAAQAPGMAVAIVKGSRVAWSHGYGLADIATNRAATPDTLFMLASVSKTVTSVALMSLVEDPSRHLSLDDDVAASLPFPVRNPSFPDTAVTFRMLLTHTSTLDGAIGLEDIGNTFDADPTVSLEEFVAGAVADPASWSTAEPGTAFSYSNLGGALAGFLVEAISGQSLEDYCQAHVFQPLGMTETSWFGSGLDPSHIAMPYEFADGAFQPQGNYGVLFYPSTELRTSANQLARFLIMFEQHGQLEGARILRPETVDEMRRPQIPNLDPDEGLIWFYDASMGTRVFGHTGGYFGVSTDMEFDPATGAGYVVLMNGGQMTTAFSDDTVNSAVTAVSAKLLALAEALP